MQLAGIGFQSRRGFRAVAWPQEVGAINEPDLQPSSPSCNADIYGHLLVSYFDHIE